MAQYVKTASLLFNSSVKEEERPQPEKVLEEIRFQLHCAKGFGLDLVVLCEGIESRGQGLEHAEEVSSPGPFLQMYMDFASSEKCHLAASVKIAEHGKVYNSIAFIYIHFIILHFITNTIFKIITIN